MNLENKKILKVSKRYKLILYLFFVALVLTIVLFLYAYKSRNKDLNNIVQFETAINNSNINSDAYIDITTEPLLIASQDNTTNGYYLISSGKYMYVIVLSNSQFASLKEEVKSNPIRLYGMTDTAPDEFKSILIEQLNESYSTTYTNSDYDTLVGQYTLNITRFSNKNYINFIYPIISMIISLSLICLYMKRKKCNNYILNKYNQKEWNKICKEINNNEYIRSGNTYITDDYILYLGTKLLVNNFNELVLMYQKNNSYNNTPVTSELVVWSKDKFKYSFVSKLESTKKQEKELMQIASKISNVNKDALIGYSTINKDKVKELYNIKI